jgi:SNF family Na+-dependent transporter
LLVKSVQARLIDGDSWAITVCSEKMAMVDNKSSSQKSISVIGVINTLLSFIMPFFVIQILLTGAWMFFRGGPDLSFLACFVVFPAIHAVSALVGVVNAVGYARKKFGSSHDE